MDIVNNKMLILARESRGRTQQQLVAMVPNLNQGNYSKMEKGLLNVPTDTLYNIAKELNYPPSFFYKEGIHTPISSFYYRKRISMTKKDMAELEAMIDILRISIDELLDSVDVPEYTLPSFQISDDFLATDVAIRLREFLRIPKGPIKNLIRILESAGILIYFLKIDNSKFDGITLLTDKGQPVIFVNESLPNDRKRFTICHEVIHLTAHIPFSPLPSERDAEQEANEGAAEFLMPYLECRNDLISLRYSQLSILKQYWGVSKAMVLYRAKEMNGITNEKYTYMVIELSRRGERKNEGGHIEIDEPSLLNLIIKTHENELGYSLNEILSMLSLQEADYFKYFKNSKYDVSVKPKKVIQFSPKQNTA
jgi:Zn-dependent peptidase ImmA (M78 family)